MDVLQNAWIMIDGMVIFSTRNDLKLQKQIFGGYFEAIEKITQNLVDEGINEIKTDTLRFFD